MDDGTEPSGPGSEASLAGKLLVAAPSLGDFFRRAVVLVVEHKPEGAFGLVLNRPSADSVDEVIEGLTDHLSRYRPEADAPMMIGGPVAPDALTCVGEHRDPADLERPLAGSIGMVDLEDPPLLERVRLYAGYAGWGPEQLDSELEAEGWIVCEFEAEDPFRGSERDGDLWSTVLARQDDGELALLARLPEDPSVN